MQFICQICNEKIEYKNQYGICKISKHLLDKHNITAQEYYDTYIDTTSHVCKICGKDVNMTCDQWIDKCLKRFKCKKYLFVVDCTDKIQRSYCGNYRK